MPRHNIQRHEHPTPLHHRPVKGGKGKHDGFPGSTHFPSHSTWRNPQLAHIPPHRFSAPPQPQPKKKVERPIPVLKCLHLDQCGEECANENMKLIEPECRPLPAVQVSQEVHLPKFRASDLVTTHGMFDVLIQITL